MFSNIYLMDKNTQTSLQGRRLKGKCIEHHKEKHGLVKIKIEGVHDNWPNDCIPWSQADEGFGHGNTEVAQMKPIPPIGATTYSRFLSDNQYHPVYTAGPSSDDKKVDDFTNDKVYPYAYGSVDQGGHKEVVNTKEGEESYTRSHVKGTSFGIDKDGNHNVASAAGINHTGKSGAMKFSEGMTMEGKTLVLKFDSIEMNGKTIALKNGAITSTTPITTGGGGPASPGATTLPQAGKRPSFSTGSSGSGSGGAGGSGGSGTA